MTPQVHFPRDFLGIPHSWWVVAAVLPILLLLGFSSTIIDLPRPIMIAELDSDRYRFQWVTGATLLGTLIGMAMISWLRDRVGLKNIHITGVFLFTIASAACGAAREGDVLAAARLVQGFGKGLSVATVLALLYREFPQHRDLAMAFYGIGIYFGKAIAPPLAAYLSDHPSWRWIFYLNVPAGIIALMMAYWILTPDRPEEAARNPFDFAGLALMMLWITALLVVLYRGQKWGWLSSNVIILLLGVFVTSLAAFIVWELRVTEPLIDLRLFKERTFALAECIKSLFAVNFYVVISLLSSYMVVLRQYPRTTAGLVLLPGGLAMGLALMAGALLAARIDRKPRLLAGLALMTGATWLFAGIDLYTDKHWIAWMFIIWGVGAGLVISPVLCIPLEGLTQAQVVRSASIKNMVRALPGAVGGLVIGHVLTRRTDAYFDALRQKIMPNRPVVESTQALLQQHLEFQGSSLDVLPNQASHIIGQYIHDNASAFAYQTGLQYLAVCILMALVLALCLQPAPRRRQATS